MLPEDTACALDRCQIRCMVFVDRRRHRDDVKAAPFKVSRILRKVYGRIFDLLVPDLPRRILAGLVELDLFSLTSKPTTSISFAKATAIGIPT